ncbi:hypothetical protein BJ742DRAFT_164784 [Cladochytrium replicatum]|nr:hypothetical protein BJ742DRAFT_164784 [Cladochytrium replicatum]
MSTASTPATPLGANIAPVAVSNSPPTPGPSQQLRTQIVVVLEATAHTAPVFESLYSYILVNLIRSITKRHKQSHIMYGLVLYSDHPPRSVSAAVKYFVTKSMDVFLSKMRKVRFSDGGVVRNAVIDGLAAGVEMLDSMAEWGPPAIDGGTTSHLILVANSLPLPMSHSNGVSRPLTLARVSQMMRTRGLKFSLVSARKGLKQLEELVNEVNRSQMEELCIGTHSVRLAFETTSQKRNGAKRAAPSASPNKSEGDLLLPPNTRPTKWAKVEHNSQEQPESIKTPSNSQSHSLSAGNQPTPTTPISSNVPVTPTNIPQSAPASSVSPPARDSNDQPQSRQQQPQSAQTQGQPMPALPPQSLPLGTLNPITAMQQMADQRLSQAHRMFQQQRNGAQDQISAVPSVQPQPQESQPLNPIPQQTQCAQGNVSGSIVIPASGSQQGLSVGSAMAPTTQNAIQAATANGINPNQRIAQTNHQQPSDLRAVITAIQLQQQRMAAAVATGNANGSTSAAGGFANALNGSVLATTGLPMGMSATRPERATPAAAPAQSVPQTVAAQAGLLNNVAQQPQLQQTQQNGSHLPSPPSQVSITSDANASAGANVGQTFFWSGTLSIPVQQATNREVSINVSASATKSANLSDFLPGHWPKRLQVSNIFPIRQQQVGLFVKNKGIPMCQMSTVATSAANNNNATREFQYFRKLVDSIGQSSSAALIQFPNAGGAQANQGLILISVNGTMLGMVLMKFPLNIALQEVHLGGDDKHR